MKRSVATWESSSTISRNTETERPSVVFVALALKQAEFYTTVAEELRDRGIRCAIISLHEPSLQMMRSRGIPAINFYWHKPATDSMPDADARRIIGGYGIDNLQRLLTHEKRVYEVTDSDFLTRKFAASLVGMEASLRAAREQVGDDIVLVQELGGFLSVIAAFFAAQRNGLPNIFIEPSFFRGRLFFARDTFSAPLVPATGRPASGEVEHYIATTLEEQRIVIPHKDRAEYQQPIRKILNRRNIWRLVEKSMQKYVRGEREEFGFIGTYVRKHLRMLSQAARLKRSYGSIPGGVPYVYYPLHVPGDFALTIRSPEYLDQFALIDYIARNLPPTHVLAVKEHPAMVGAFAVNRMRELLRLNDNVVILSPSENNLSVIRDAAAVITVNSKSGAEALLLGRPVVVLGDAFYRPSRLVTKLDSLSDLAVAIRTSLTQPPLDARAVRSFFQGVWDNSFPGELYNPERENCGTFADSLLSYLGTNVDSRLAR